MDDQIRAQLQRTLKIGRSEGIVHDQDGLAGMMFHHLGNGADIRDSQQGIGGCLQPHDARGRGQGFGEVLRIGCVGKCKVQTEATQHFIKQAKCAAVDIIARDDVISLCQHS